MMSNGFYSERGGIRVGNGAEFEQINYTFPFAKVVLSDRELRLSYPFRRLVLLKKEEVVSVEIFKGKASLGVRIHHTRHDYPLYLVFWSIDACKLISVLHARGWPCVDI